MLVANSFDLWKKDVFFPAAEEVQESADIMESTYRAWARERGESVAPEDLDELCRVLQTALGSQMAALSASFSAEGKKHLRWVQLDEEECDDLAAFLSGTTHCIPSAKNDHVKLGPSVKSSEEKPMRRKDVDIKSNAACNLDISVEIKGVKDCY